MGWLVFLDHAHGYFAASDWSRDCHCPWGMSVRKLKITAMMQGMRQKAREDDSGDCTWGGMGEGGVSEKCCCGYEVDEAQDIKVLSVSFLLWCAKTFIIARSFQFHQHNATFNAP